MSAAAFGIPLALVTTSAFNTGLILEKRALDRMPALNVRKVTVLIVSLLANPAWLAGFALVATGLALQVIVLTFEPISLVQPVLASGLALSLVLSRLVLRERLGGGETWCVVTMVVSLVLLALSQEATPAGTAQNASAVSALAVIVPSTAAGLLIAAWPLRRRLGRHRSAATGICAGLGTGLLYGVASLATKGLSGVLAHSHTITGIVAGIALSPYLYLLGGCSVAALLLYQAALQACRASILIPVSNVMSGLYFVVVGTWLFHEHLPSSPVKLALRLAGIATAGLVLVILSRHATPPPPPRTPPARTPGSPAPESRSPETRAPVSPAPWSFAPGSRQAVPTGSRPAARVPGSHARRG
jgi:Magnesium transporter NIPA